MNEIQLKSALQELVSSKRLPDVGERTELTEAMLHWIGSTDSELRDELIYEQFDRWVEAELFPPNELADILTRLLDKDHLNCGLGSSDDRVFARSFSLLWLAVLVYYHRDHAWLEAAVWQRLQEIVLLYAAGEADLRGYVPEKGWAHAPAHWADVVGQLLLCPECDAACARKLLQAVAAWLEKADRVFSFAEDERLARAALRVGTTHSEQRPILEEWLQSLSFSPISSDLPRDYVRAMNTKQFLRAAYFQLRRENDTDRLIATLERILI